MPGVGNTQRRPLRNEQGDVDDCIHAALVADDVDVAAIADEF